MTRIKIVKEKYYAVFNSAVGDKNHRIVEIKTPQKLPAIRYAFIPTLSYDLGLLKQQICRRPDNFISNKFLLKSSKPFFC